MTKPSPKTRGFLQIDSGPQPWLLGFSAAFHVPKSQSTLPFQSAWGGRTTSQLGRQLVETDFSSPASWPPRALSFPSSREAVSVSRPGDGSTAREQRPSRPPLCVHPALLSLCGVHCELLCAPGPGAGRRERRGREAASGVPESRVQIPALPLASFVTGRASGRLPSSVSPAPTSWGCGGDAGGQGRGGAGVSPQRTW